MFCLRKRFLFGGRRIIVPVLCGLALALAIFCQRCGAEPGEWTTHVNSSDLNYVFSDGSSIWCASTGGALRFDPGTEDFSKIVRNKPGTLVSNELSCVAVTQGQLTWFGTPGLGLNLLNQGQWLLFTEGFTGLPSDYVKSLAADGTFLWVGTTKGLALFENASLIQTFTVSSTSGGIPNNIINDVAVRSDTAWCATLGGVARGIKTLGVWSWQVLNSGLGNLNVSSVAFSGGSVWVAAQDGTYEYVSGTWVKRGGAPSSFINDLREAGGRFYAAEGDSGVYVWESGSWQRAMPTLIAGRYRSLTSDASGNLWCATSAGLVLYDGTDWLLIEPPGPAYDYVEDLSVSEDGVVWGATRSNMVALKFKDGEWLSYNNATTGGQFQDTWLFSVFASGRDTVWFGHCCCDFCRVDRLVTSGDTELWSAFGLINSKDIVPDAAGVVWFSSYGNGVYAYDPSDGSETNVRASVGGLTSNSVETIAPVDQRRRWIGHLIAGVDFWDDAGTEGTSDDAWRHFTTTEGLASMSVTSSAVTGSRVYFGTVAGISVFEDSLWSKNYGASDLAPASAEVNDLAVDPFGNVWVATTAGVARIGIAGDVTVYNYSSSGLVNDQVLCVAINEQEGQIWFGTPNGISVFEAWSTVVTTSLHDAYVYPNPFKPGAGDALLRIGGLATPAEASIYDLAGRKVKSLGTVEDRGVLWDGTDDGGGSVPAGVYLIKLKTESVICIKKVALIR